MTKDEMVSMLRRSVEEWNEWRGKTDIREAIIDLSDANLSDLDLDGCNLYNSDLSYSNLSNTSLMNADIRFCSLVGTDLSNTCLIGADLRDTILPPPPMVLLANWCGDIPDDLCLDLMRYDCSLIPEGNQLFAYWAKYPTTKFCPYIGSYWSRAALFQEKHSIWSPGPAPTALELVERLFNHFKVKR